MIASAIEPCGPHARQPQFADSEAGRSSSPSAVSTAAIALATTRVAIPTRRRVHSSAGRRRNAPALEVGRHRWSAERHQRQGPPRDGARDARRSSKTNKYPEIIFECSRSVSASPATATASGKPERPTDAARSNSPPAGNSAGGSHGRYAARFGDFPSPADRLPHQGRSRVAGGALQVERRAEIYVRHRGPSRVEWARKVSVWRIPCAWQFPEGSLRSLAEKRDLGAGRSSRRAPQDRSRTAAGRPPVAGDWVLIHVGFAMSKISEEDAADQMRMLDHAGRDEAAMQEIEGYGMDDTRTKRPSAASR